LALPRWSVGTRGDANAQTTPGSKYGEIVTELPRKLEPFLVVVEDDGDNRHGSPFFAEDVLFPHCGAIGEDLYQSDFIQGRFMLKKKDRFRHLGFFRWSHQPDNFGECIETISEIVYGSYKSDRPVYHLSNFRNIFFPAVNILGFDSKAAYACGRIRAELGSHVAHGIKSNQ